MGKQMTMVLLLAGRLLLSRGCCEWEPVSSTLQSPSIWQTVGASLDSVYPRATLLLLPPKTLPPQKPL